MKNTLSFSLAVALVGAALSSCVTNYINPSTTENPPPSEPLSAFEQFEMEPFVIAPAYADSEANQKAVDKIQLETKLKMEPVLEEWNANGNPNGRKLLIKPFVQDVKFISGGVRFFAGALAGSSAVIVKLELVDAETGDMVANPEFYQHARAYAGAWSVGGTDNAMLIRMSSLISDYLVSNYEEAVGGPTGAPRPEDD